MKKFILLIFFFLFQVMLANAQVTMSIHDTTVVQSQGSISVPVYVSNFNEIGAISLVISYDNKVLTYTGTTSLISTGSFTTNAVNGEVRISWYDTSPLNLGTGTLLYLNFNIINGNSSLNFITSSCEIADTAASVLPVVYQNGSVTITPSLVLPAKLSGLVWYDANGNGVKDPGENVLRWGVWIDLFTGNGVWKKGMLTDSNGVYSFDSLAPGSYYIVPYLIGGYKGYKFTKEFASPDSAISSQVQQVTDSTGKSIVVTLASGEDYSTLNIGTVQAVTSVLSGNPESSSNALPKSLNLSQNYPNPFNPSTIIRFGLPEQERVTLIVYNILGEKVATLIDGEQSAGYHSVTFDASRLASGIYIYQLRGIHLNITKKMMLTK